VPSIEDDSRRFPRLAARCRVRLVDRFGAWDVETEDVGPRGCRIATARPQTVGALVRLTLWSDAVAAALDVTGQVVWARAGRAGISFAGRALAPGAIPPSDWFQRLAAAAGGERSPRGAPEVPIEVELEPAPLAQRLLRRSQELLETGDRAAAEVIVVRALAIAPGDAALERALGALRAR
jgi:hypothetical protein